MRSILESSQFARVRLSPETWFFGDLFRAGVRSKIRKMGDMSDDCNIHKLVDHLYAIDINRTFWNQIRSRELDIPKPLMLEQFLESDRSERSLYHVLMKLTAEARLGLRVDENIIIGDKMPGNLYHVPTLIDWFPDAKVIHMFRDPRAILASEWRRLMDQRRRTLASRFMNPLYSAIVVMYVTVTWLYATRLDRRYSDDYPENYRLFKYEDLVERPRIQVKELCEYVGIDMDDEMMTPVKKGSSFNYSAGKGFDKEAVNRWRTQLRPWMRFWITLLGGRLMKRFGYSPW